MATDSDTTRQFRELRDRMFAQGAALGFTANGAVAAAIVQWLLRVQVESEPIGELVRWFALLSAAIHSAGAALALTIPSVRMRQFWRDHEAGSVENPLQAAPLRRLVAVGRCFVAGIAVLALGLLLRELCRG